MSDYDFVASGSLKLKSGVSSKNKKKKNKHKLKDAKRQKDLIEKVLEDSTDSGNDRSNPAPTERNSWMTEAEKKFLAQQEKRQLEKVMAKAQKSHKQRVEEFNTHLENLTEHYDIPKVSWTK